MTLNFDCTCDSCKSSIVDGKVYCEDCFDEVDSKAADLIEENEKLVDRLNQYE